MRDLCERCVKAAEDNQSVIGSINTKMNGILTLMETGGTLLADGTEQSIYINNTPLGVYKPICLMINLDNMTTAAGDVMEIKEYYRINPAGNLELLDYNQYTGDDGGLTNGKKLIQIDLAPCRFGIKVTLKQTVGTNRNYDWSVCYEE